MLYKRRLGVVCLVFLCAFRAFAGNALLRDPHASCGLYFSDSEGTHGQKIASLDPKEFKHALTSLVEDRAPSHLALVGVDPSQAKELELELRSTLSSLGYSDVSIATVRRLSEFIANEVGLFARQGTEWKRVSSLDAQDIQSALKTNPELKESDLLVVGMPLFGNRKKEIQSVLKNEDVQTYKTQTPWYVAFQKTLRSPVGAVSHTMQNLRFFFPVKEDFVAPSDAEYRSALQKIMIPGAITFSVLLSQGQPLEILIPVTLTNAANSYTTGTFRSFLGNWWRRSTTFFPSQWAKNVVISSFFTATLYWAGMGSLDRLDDVTTLLGWQTFVTSKWLSVLFQTIWRAPVQSAIYNWEEQKLATLDGVDAQTIRQSGSAMEKYISYVMTQFYIYSIATKSSLFDIVYSSVGGISIAGSEAIHDSSTTVLMQANVGHAAMAALGGLAFIMLKNVKVIDRLAGVALKFDRIESNFLGVFKSSWSWLSANLWRTKSEKKEDQENTKSKDTIEGDEKS